MNIYIAVISTLLAGITAALYAYGIKGSVSTHRVLALLRFAWFSLLVYAFLSGAVLVKTNTEVTAPVSILTDTSSSLQGGFQDQLENIESSLEELGIPTVVLPFIPHAVPSSGQWMYLGDGHIEDFAKDAELPKAAVLLPAKPLAEKPLISGISVPSAVQSSTVFKGMVHTPPDASIRLSFNGQRQSKGNFEFRAPQKAGTYTLEAVAVRGDQIDTLTYQIQVVEHFATWLVVSNAPHPHEGMIRRYARKHGIAIKTQTFEEFTAPWLGPTIVIGQTEPLKERIAVYCKGPVWFMSDATPRQAKSRKSFTVPSFPTGHLPISASLRVVGKNAQLRLARRSIESSAVQWYASVIESEQNQELFEVLCATLQVWHTPNRIEMNVPQRIFQNESYRVSAAAVGGNNLPLDANISVLLKDGQGRIIDRPVITTEMRGGAWNMRLNIPGKYSLKVIAEIGTEVLSSTRFFEVMALDIESVRPLNTALWQRSIGEGSVVVEGIENWKAGEVDWQVTSVDIVKKNPQHNTWWYWGLALLFAALEWLFRRRQGMV